MDAERIAEMRRLEARATPGPWYESHGGLAYTPSRGGVSPVRLHHDDRALIAAARNALPALLDRLAELEEALGPLARLGAGMSDTFAVLNVDDDEPLAPSEDLCREIGLTVGYARRAAALLSPEGRAAELESG